MYGKRVLKVKCVNGSGIELNPDTHEWDIINGHGLWWNVKEGRIRYFIPLPQIISIEDWPAR